MKRKARMRLNPEQRKEAEVAQRQFSLAKALFYNGWLSPEQLPHIQKWRSSNKFDAEVIAAAVAPFEDNMRRAFNNVILRVHIGETEVCFNCLQPFVENDPKGGRNSTSPATVAFSWPAALQHPGAGRQSSSQMHRRMASHL